MVDYCRKFALGGVVAFAVGEMVGIVVLSKWETCWPVKTFQ